METARQGCFSVPITQANGHYNHGPSAMCGRCSFAFTGYGFVDGDGRFVIEPRFDEAECFCEGRAAVKVAEAGYGFIDPSGQERVPCKYTLVYRFSEGLAAFSKTKAADRLGFLGPDGQEVLKPQWHGADVRFSAGLACVWKDQKHGYIDQTGKLIIGYEYGIAEAFSCGLALCGFKKRGAFSYGFIHPSGEWAIEPRFGEANSFESGLAMVSDGVHEGYIDVSGAWVRRWKAE